MNLQKKEMILPSDLLTERLLKGSAGIFPTDTLPAIGAIPNYAEQLWRIKQRSFEKPLILMAADQNDLFEYVLKDALEDALIMAQNHWPGALTLVLPASGEIVDKLNPGGNSLGMRVPNCHRAMELLIRTGPLATTSANLSGDKASMNNFDAAKCFPEVPLLGPVPWTMPSGLASTVIEWESNASWKVLRRGCIKPKLSEEL